MSCPVRLRSPACRRSRAIVPTAAAARRGRPPAPLRSDADRDVFGVEVLLDALVPALAPEAGLLDAAERRLGVGDDALIEADHAGLQPFADADRAFQVAGEDVGDQAIFGVVGGRDRLLLLGEAEHRGDRAEDLLLPELGVLRDAGEHGGLEEVPRAVT